MDGEDSRHDDYKDTQLKTMLEQVGFRQVETHKNGKGWLCVTARK